MGSPGTKPSNSADFPNGGLNLASRLPLDTFVNSKSRHPLPVKYALFLPPTQIERETQTNGLLLAHKNEQKEEVHGTMTFPPLPPFTAPRPSTHSRMQTLKEDLPVLLQSLQSPVGVLWVTAALLIVIPGAILFFWLLHVGGISTSVAFVAIQLLNAVFTLVALWNFPFRLHWLYITLREYRRNKINFKLRRHIKCCDWPSLFFLHLNCYAQFAVATLLYTGLGNSPFFIVLLVTAMTSGAVGGAYPHIYKKTALAVKENRKNENCSNQEQAAAHVSAGPMNQLPTG